MPLLFVHEFSNDMRGWEAQVRYFSRSYRCITFNARGYPPSDVPERDDAYGHEHAVADIGAILDHLEIDSAFIVGLSMGATGALQFMLANPGRVRGLVFASGGSGSDAASRPAQLGRIPPTAVAEFNRAVDNFLSAVRLDNWPVRDIRANAGVRPCWPTIRRRRTRPTDIEVAI